MDTIIAFLLAWISTISGVALGGWLVYRTKRDSYDPLFSRGKAGEVFNIEDDLTVFDGSPSSASLPKATASANDAFVQQFADRMAEKAVG